MRTPSIVASMKSFSTTRDLVAILAADGVFLFASAAWKELHEQVDGLPEDQREVVGLVFYQGMTQVEAAQILEVTVRTVQNRLKSATFALRDLLTNAWSEESTSA